MGPGGTRGHGNAGRERHRDRDRDRDQHQHRPGSAPGPGSAPAPTGIGIGTGTVTGRSRDPPGSLQAPAPLPGSSGTRTAVGKPGQSPKAEPGTGGKEPGKFGMGPGSTGRRAGTAASGSATTGSRSGTTGRGSGTTGSRSATTGSRSATTGRGSGTTGILLLLLGAAAAAATPSTAPPPCPPDHLLCGDGSCLSRHFACDGDRDCPDGRDELGCAPPPPASPSPPPPCPPSSFRCRDGSCIPRLWSCDGDRDCRDGEDEGEGLCGPPRPPRACPPLQFSCGSGECLTRRWRCDGSPDCRDSSDEEGCAPPPPCPPGQLLCRDRRCIPAARACDGTPDCRDGDDEEDCPDAPSCPPPHRFRCRSGECIAIAQVCDGRRHCRDWSDEPLKECGVNECLAGAGGCSHGCRDLRLGYECVCPAGLGLEPDNRTCLGPPGSLLVSARHRLLALGGAAPRVLQGALKHAGPLDAAVAGGALFWGDPSEGRIYTAPLAGGPAVPLAELGGPGAPAGLALDWTHGLLYWTEPGAGRVAVAESSGRRQRTLQRDPRTRPWAVVVDPQNGFLYWSDWGSRPQITRGAQDGAPPEPLVTEGVERPQGLALDPLSQRLFWADGRLQAVSSVGLDGRGRRTLLRDPRHLQQPLGLAVFQDWLVWTDPPRGSLVAARLRGGSSPSPPRLLAQELFSPEAVLLLHPDRQPPGRDRCRGSLCSFLCLPSPARGPGSAPFTCACPDGEHLAGDGRTCGTEPPGTPEPRSRNLSAGGNGPGAAAGDLGRPGGAGPLMTSLGVLGVLLPLGLALGAAARALWRGWRRRSSLSISFSNAAFRKGPQHLRGAGQAETQWPLTAEEDEP